MTDLPRIIYHGREALRGCLKQFEAQAGSSNFIPLATIDIARAVIAKAGEDGS